MILTIWCRMQVKHREEENETNKSGSGHERAKASEETKASGQDCSHAADPPDAQCGIGERIFKISSKCILQSPSIPLNSPQSRSIALNPLQSRSISPNPSQSLPIPSIPFNPLQSPSIPSLACHEVPWHARPLRAGVFSARARELKQGLKIKFTR